MRTIAHRTLAWALSLGLLALPACNRGGVEVDVGLRRVTVGARQRPVETNFESEIRNTRLGVREVLRDVRDAWTRPVGESLLVQVAASGQRTLRTSATLLLPEGVEPPAAGTVAFRFEWTSHGQADAIAERELPVGDALEWVALEHVSDVPNDTRGGVTFSARLKGCEIPGARVAWSVPVIPGYQARPFVEKNAQGPNVLLISIDTLRADHLGCYGYERATSPVIDRLARQGVLFEEAVSQAPWTLPSYGSLFTGLWPGRHHAGMVLARQTQWGTAAEERSRLSEPLRRDVPTLAQLLRNAGWRTAAFTNNPFLDPVRGVDRGFQRYVSYAYTAEHGVDLAREFVEGQAQNPWFVFLHLMDPHYPYTPPPPWDAKFGPAAPFDLPPGMQALRRGGASEEMRAVLERLYDGEIAYADHQIGRLVDALVSRGVLQNTIVIVHSDHGEEFWEHGGFEHGHALWQEVLRVPLILRYPDRLPIERRIPSRVRAFDLMPTLLELLGLSVPPDLDAQSLLPVIEGRETLHRDALAEFMLWGEHEHKARYGGGLKLIAGWPDTCLLFDLEKDPGELHDLCGAQPGPARGLRAVLDAHHAGTVAGMPSKPTELPADLVDTPRIEAFGYSGEEEAAPPKKR